MTHQAREAQQQQLGRPPTGGAKPDTDDETVNLSSPSTPEGAGTVPIPSDVLDGSVDMVEKPTAANSSPSLSSSVKFRGGSGLSLDSMKEGRGIRLGTSRAVGGVTTQPPITGNSSSDEGRAASGDGAGGGVRRRVLS